MSRPQPKYIKLTKREIERTRIESWEFASKAAGRLPFLDGALKHSDWYLDGYPVKGELAIKKFDNLDWSKAWIDLGPSPSGNLGPYWHVPHTDEGTIHRLYPKALKTKFGPLLLRASLDIQKSERQK